MLQSRRNKFFLPKGKEDLSGDNKMSKDSNDDNDGESGGGGRDGRGAMGGRLGGRRTIAEGATTRMNLSLMTMMVWRGGAEGRQDNNEDIINKDYDN
jgi:hypothetical protein